MLSPVEGEELKPTGVLFDNSILFALFFLSGFSALIYEVLWLKELSLLFGSTSYAAATTLAVFFLGLSAGGYFWGKQAGGLKNPLVTYGILELAIAVSALLYFLMLDLFYLIYTPFYHFVGQNLFLSVTLKFFLALGILFLPAFLMGGTFPVMGQHLIRNPEQLGIRGSILYAVNTVGAALGALVAGFYMPILFGFKNSYLIAVVINLLIGGSACLIGFIGKSGIVKDKWVATPAPDNPAGAIPRNQKIILSVAFLSGFITLALEVLWTRMFAQVLHNSVYSFSAILVIFLISLALGSVVANLLCRLKWSPFNIFCALLMLSGILVGLTPIIFFSLTNGLRELVSQGGWSAYVREIFLKASIVILFPGIMIGSIFPYLLKISQRTTKSVGKTIGQLASVNALGGIIGSLTAGFFMPHFIGLWASIKLMAILYFLVSIFATDDFSIKRLWPRSIPAVALVLIILFSYSSSLPLVSLNPEAMEKIHALWEGSHGIVSVVSQKDDLILKVNNYYSLGGVKGFYSEQRQTQIPLFIHPNPKSLFFLGLGTGITAGAALDFPVHRIVSCELIPEVVLAAKKYFRRFNNRLFSDDRSRVVTEDGRNFLLGTADRYDVIVSDLFIPWHSGTGALYSKEHFELVQSRLKKGGLFMQWVPNILLSKREFDIIARTMLEVFPNVTLWRLDFVPHLPTIGLIAQNEEIPLDPEAIQRRVNLVIKRHSPHRITEGDVIPYVFYAGNLSENRHLFDNSGVNSDDRPLLEYLSPRTRQEEKSGETSFFVSYQLLELFETLFTLLPPEKDPFLRNLSPQQIDFVRAGLSLYKVVVLRSAGKLDEARALYENFLQSMPFNVFPDLK